MWQQRCWRPPPAAARRQILGSRKCDFLIHRNLRCLYHAKLRSVFPQALKLVGLEVGMKATYGNVLQPSLLLASSPQKPLPRTHTNWASVVWQTLRRPARPISTYLTGAWCKNIQHPHLHAVQDIHVHSAPLSRTMRVCRRCATNIGSKSDRNIAAEGASPTEQLVGRSFMFNNTSCDILYLQMQLVQVSCPLC